MSDDVPHGAVSTPVSNTELFGHPDAERLLRQAFESNRLHHAWMISGPRGIGKSTLAYRFAKYVLANAIADAGLFGTTAFPDERSDLHLAMDHPVFQRVVAGGHGNLLVIERSENDRGTRRSKIVVEDVRRTQNFFHMTAGEGGWRIVIVDSADEMNVNAANALLKVLEEPPPRALLLLVSHNPGQLLPTIRSRCQQIRLEPLAATMVADWLSQHVPETSSQDLQTITVLADGSIGRALGLLECGGISVFTEVMTLFEGAPQIDGNALHAFAAKCAGKKGVDTFAMADEMIRWVLVRAIKYASGDRTGEFTDREQALYGRLGDAVGLDRWLEVWDKVDELLASTDRVNLDRKQVILNTFSCVSQAASAR